MIKLIRKIEQQLGSQRNNILKWKNNLLILALLTSSFIFSQVPPPPCEANGNSGFGGAVGEGHFFFSGEGSNPIIFDMATSSNEMNDILVLYIDTGAPGRSEIDATVDDSADDHRIAISNSNVFDNGSIINFPTGFEASYAVAIDVNFGGLWSIPSAGEVGVGELEFITAINSNLTSSTQGFYQFSFNWEDIGLTITDEFQFVGLFVSNTGYSSDEGYGDGIVSGTEGSDTISYTGYITLPDCSETLSTTVNSSNDINAYYFNGKLFIEGINEVATITVYDIQGRKTYNSQHRIRESEPIPFELTKNELQFIVIESSHKKKVLKVIPN